MLVGSRCLWRPHHQHHRQHLESTLLSAARALRCQSAAAAAEREREAAATQRLVGKGVVEAARLRNLEKARAAASRQR